mmetsp:Transcript_27111/g.44478  ORF Transcript_27111/g.44478 Transcript_27111/m.44478 type:complete len:222 (+) Transcript_27111:84-749(+)
MEISVHRLHDREEEQRSLIDHALLSHKLLQSKPKNCNHGKASILDFCKLHSFLTRFVRGVAEAQAKVSRKVVFGVAFHSKCAQDFYHCSDSNTSNPVRGRNLAKTSIEQRWYTIVTIQQGVHTKRYGNFLIVQFTQWPSGGGKHSKTGVLHLGFAVVHKVGFRFSKTKWIEAGVSGEGTVESRRAGKEGKRLGPDCILLGHVQSRWFDDVLGGGERRGRCR